jgi:hypothetical protein
MKPFLVLSLIFFSVVLAARSAAAPNAPVVHLEDIEWCDVWFPHVNDTCHLPRVLLIGDSITRAYFDAVDKLLAGKAMCSRICTSRCVGDPALLEEIATFGHREKYAVVHFNNGMHGFANSEADYAKGLPDFVATVQKTAPEAKLIWASTTAVRKDCAGTNNDRIKERNHIASELVSKLAIAVDDQFALTVDHPEWHADAIHFGSVGVDAQAAQVAQSISQALAP